MAPGRGLRVNRQTPLWKIVDGVTHSWSVLDPLQDASLTIRLKQPMTVESLAVWPTISPGLAVAKAVYIEPLHQVSLPVKPSALVVGGGVAGLEAALGIARQGCRALSTLA